MPPTWIAEEPVVFVHPDGQRVAGRIAIGLPGPDGRGASVCPVALDGLFDIGQKPGIFGEGNLQALLLAARFAGYTLHAFLSRGGRVVGPGEPEDHDVPLSALFGPLLAPLDAD
jgi:hypothetical protein